MVSEDLYRLSLFLSTACHGGNGNVQMGESVFSTKKRRRKEKRRRRRRRRKKKKKKSGDEIDDDDNIEMRQPFFKKSIFFNILIF